LRHGHPAKSKSLRLAQQDLRANKVDVAPHQDQGQRNHRNAPSEFSSQKPSSSQSEKTRTRMGSMSACIRITSALAMPIPSTMTDVKAPPG